MYMFPEDLLFNRALFLMRVCVHNFIYSFQRSTALFFSCSVEIYVCVAISSNFRCVFVAIKNPKFFSFELRSVIHYFDRLLAELTSQLCSLLLLLKPLYTRQYVKKKKRVHMNYECVFVIYNDKFHRLCSISFSFSNHNQSIIIIAVILFRLSMCIHLS